MFDCAPQATLCTVFCTICIVNVFYFRSRTNSLHKRTKAAADVEYPAYGVTGPNRDSAAGIGVAAATAGDRKLAQNAQMYHYQHQKQQIIAMENTTRSAAHSEQPSEDENEEGDYTVYECPGLAPVSKRLYLKAESKFLIHIALHYTDR